MDRRIWVVGRILHMTPAHLRVEDFNESAWNVPLDGGFAIRPADGAAERRYRSLAIKSQLHRIHLTLKNEIADSKPMTRPEEYKPEDWLTVETRLGPRSWPRRDAPMRTALDKWRKLGHQAEQLEAELDRLSIKPALPPVGRTIPSIVEVDMLADLARRDLLADDERGAVELMARFWQEHRNAESGVMEADGTISPREHTRRPHPGSASR